MGISAYKFSQVNNPRKNEVIRLNFFFSYSYPNSIKITTIDLSILCSLSLSLDDDFKHHYYHSYFNKKKEFYKTN